MSIYIISYTVRFILFSPRTNPDYFVRVKHYGILFSLNTHGHRRRVCLVWTHRRTHGGRGTRSPPGQKRSENIFARSDGVDKRLANVIRRNANVKINREKCSINKYIWASGARVNGGTVIISGSFRSATNLITSRHRDPVTGGAPKHFRHKFSDVSIHI